MTTPHLVGRILFGAFLLVLLMSPFEAGYPPLGRFLWATYTNLEALIFLMGAVWALKIAMDPSARRRLIRLPLLLPIAALVGASILSTLLGEYKAMGAHFIYRLLMGVLVYATASEVLNNKRRVLTALGTFVMAGAISAILGLLEYAPWIDIEPWLMAFKPQPTTVGGMLRLSGSFEYANGAAIYLEMALPVLLSMVVLFSSRRMSSDMFGEGRLSETARRALQVALFGLVGVITMALILTFSRAAWAGAAFAVGVIGVAAITQGRKQSDQRVESATGMLWPVGVAVGVVGMAAIYISATQPLLLLRLTSGENDQGWYKSSIEPGTVPILSAGDVVTVPVTLHNLGPMTWQSRRTPAIHLSYHWANTGNQQGTNYYAVFEGERTELPHDVARGEAVSVQAVLQAPAKSGEYYLEWDLVQEGVAWFELKAGPSAQRTLSKVAPPAAGAVMKPDAATLPPRIDVQNIKNADTSTVPRQLLWKAAFDMFRAQPITGVGPDGFRNLYGKYVGKTEWNKNIYTNNTYIEMFTNLGIVGGLAFLWLAGLAIWRAVRNIMRERPGSVWVICLGATASIMAFFLHGVADYFLFATPIYVIFWFLLAASTKVASTE